MLDSRRRSLLPVCLAAVLLFAARGPVEAAVQVYGTVVPEHWGQPSLVHAAGAAVDAQGNLYLAGHVRINANAGVTMHLDVLVWRIDADGTPHKSVRIGGGADDKATAIAVDAAGDVYITGQTSSNDFPVKNAADPTRNFGTDAFVVKLRWGQDIVYSTYIGGDGDDIGYGIAVDSAGSAYITGLDFSTGNVGWHTGGFGSSEFSPDAFVTKLSPEGNAIVYSVEIAGTGSEEGRAIAVDSNGRARVTGWTTSGKDPNDPSCGCHPFPTVNALQPLLRGSERDLFILTLSADGTTLVQSTFFGGTGAEEGLGLDLDPAGNLYLTGWTTSNDFPTVNAYQSAHAGDRDAFVTKLDPEVRAVVYSTYLGGAGPDTGNAIAVDAAGSAHVTGRASPTFPLFRRLTDADGRHDSTMFTTGLTPDGARLEYSTFNLRYHAITEGTGIGVDALGNVYIGGYRSDLEDAFPLAFKLAPSTRREQGDPSITYEGIWQLEVNEGWSGARAVYATDPGARAILRFTGTGFSWVGGRSNASGVASVSVDGGTPHTIDLYRSDTQVRRDVPLFTTTGLAAGPHIVTITVSSARNQNSTGSFIWVDAFEVSTTPAGPGPTPTPTPTSVPARRIEQTDPSVVKAGTWYTNSNAGHSGGSAILAMDRGDTVTVTFEGTGIRWIGLKDQWAGMAELELDGVAKHPVDTFSATQQRQATIVTFTGLAPGTHTLKILVSGTRNPASGGAWVWVDAFDIVTDAGTPTPTPTDPVATPTPTPTNAPPPPTPTPTPGGTPTVTRVEDSDARVGFAGNWFTKASTQHSGGGAHLAMDAGSTATLAFEGTGVRWIGLRDPWAGIARIFIDGALAATIDTYSATAQPRSTLFASAALAAGPHTIRVEATGTRNPASGGAWVWVDAFDVVTGGTPMPTPTPTPTGPPTMTPTPTPTPAGTPTRFEETAATYTGTWFANGSASHTASRAMLAMDMGSAATFTFNGTGITWIGYADEWSGIARIFVDGTLRATVDTYSSPAQARKALFTATGLTPGTHTLRIEVTGTRNPASGGAWVWVDAFDVAGGT